MNDLYFSCKKCLNFVDAGYRHAYWALEEPSVVRRGEFVDAHAVLQTEEYWDDHGAEWLATLLPSVRRFLEVHGAHDLRFGDAEDLDLPYTNSPEQDGYRLFDWLMEDGFVLQVLPRYFIERLGFRTWDQVVQYVERSECRPRWWDEPRCREVAQKRFLTLATRMAEARSDNAV